MNITEINHIKKNKKVGKRKEKMSRKKKQRDGES